jgi:hypothetical protein
MWEANIGVGEKRHGLFRNFLTLYLYISLVSFMDDRYSVFRIDILNRSIGYFSILALTHVGKLPWSSGAHSLIFRGSGLIEALPVHSTQVDFSSPI